MSELDELQARTKDPVVLDLIVRFVTLEARVAALEEQVRAMTKAGLDAARRQYGDWRSQ